MTPRAIASLGEWNLTGSPSSRSWPLSGACAPAMIFPRVDLPAPFSPTSAWIEPRADGQADALQGARSAERLGNVLQLDMRALEG